MFWVIHVTQLALHLTITPDNREYTVVRNRAHTCVPIVHPPTFLKTAIYVTPGRVHVMLKYGTLTYGLYFTFGVRRTSLRDGCPSEGDGRKAERSRPNFWVREVGKSPHTIFFPPKNSFMGC
jgi:hypothetical protein